MPKQIRAAVLAAPKTIVEESRTVSSPGPGEVQLRVRYVGLCGSDQQAFWGNATHFEFPRIVGHEFCAQIELVGAEVEGLDKGQWVAAAPLLSCRTCEYCRLGKGYLCHRRTIFGVQVDGALKQRLVMPADLLFPLPDNMTPVEGVLAEPLAVALHAIRCTGDNLQGSKAVISGAGMIGLSVALLLESIGVGSILLLDINEERLRFAHELGFSAMQAAEARRSVADLLFIANDSASAIMSVPELLAPLGTAVVIGLIHGAHLDWYQLLLKEGRIATARYFTLQEFGECVAFLGNHNDKAGSLIQEVFSFSELFEDAGLKVMSRARSCPRVAIKLS